VTCALDPADRFDPAFVDAMLGIESLCRYLGLIDDGTGLLGDPPFANTDSDLEPIDALLGLMSVSTTARLLVETMAAAPSTRTTLEPGRWDRQLLR
jgi:hypothetical protein